MIKKINHTLTCVINAYVRRVRWTIRMMSLVRVSVSVSQYFDSLVFWPRSDCVLKRQREMYIVEHDRMDRYLHGRNGA